MRLPDSKLVYYALAGLRQFRTAKVHSGLVIMTLTIGIAGATALTGVLRGVLFRPLPYTTPADLLSLGEFHPERGRDQSTMSLATLEDTRAAARSFAAMAGLSYSEFVLSGMEEAERIIGVAMEAGAFSVLGLQPRLGRDFQPGGWAAASAWWRC